MFEVIGVIDLRDGAAVRARGGRRDLYQPIDVVAGERVRPGDATALARHYVDRFGLTCLYVADLDAIERGAPNTALVRSVASVATVWLDAGVSSVDAAQRALDCGAARVIVGLETLPSFAVLESIVRHAGADRVVFSLDLRDGKPLTPVEELAHQRPEVLAARAADAGVRAVVVLDLARVGAGSGLDLDLLARVRSSVGEAHVYAGGGVRDAGDLEQLRRADCDGALVASALLDGNLTMTATLGWAIGGVNTKVARVAGGAVLSVCSRPFELQHDPAALVDVLRELAAETGATGDETHAVTMTAELSQRFRTKRDGVRFVLDAVVAAFPGAPVFVYAVDGRFLSVADACQSPLVVAAANWAATARIVAKSVSNALLIDIGTTSTDIIPIVDGDVAALGWTDPDRLASGELVYSGAVRTPVEALAPSVPLNGEEVGLSAESFALSGDVHLWRRDLEPADYTTPTPDRRPATREFAGERLARAICADREMVNEAGVTALADGLAAAQATRIAAAITRIRARHPALHIAVVTGLGAFIAGRAARQAGLDVVTLSSALGDDAARCAPAASVALLFDGSASDSGPRTLRRQLHDGHRSIDTVVKVGGGLLGHDGCLDAVLSALTDMARGERLVIVPGGGPFADTVRAQDAACHLSDDAAHWMAVLAMDQYAHLIVSRMRGAVLVSDAAGMSAVFDQDQVPVLAPYAWLRRDDPLPHSWQVTSDSIAAWLARALGARRLLLVKPPGCTPGPDSVDGYFAQTRGSLDYDLVPADALDTLQQATRS